MRSKRAAITGSRWRRRFSRRRTIRIVPEIMAAGGSLEGKNRANKDLVARTEAPLLSPTRRRHAAAISSPTVRGCRVSSFNFLVVTGESRTRSSRRLLRRQGLLGGLNVDPSTLRSPLVQKPACARYPSTLASRVGAIQAFSSRATRRAAARCLSPPPTAARARRAFSLTPPLWRRRAVQCDRSSCWSSGECVRPRLRVGCAMRRL